MSDDHMSSLFFCGAGCGSFVCLMVGLFDGWLRKKKGRGWLRAALVKEDRT